MLAIPRSPHSKRSANMKMSQSKIAGVLLSFILPLIACADDSPIVDVAEDDLSSRAIAALAPTDVSLLLPPPVDPSPTHLAPGTLGRGGAMIPTAVLNVLPKKLDHASTRGASLLPGFARRRRASRPLCRDARDRDDRGMYSASSTRFSGNECADHRRWRVARVLPSVAHPNPLIGRLHGPRKARSKHLRGRTTRGSSGGQRGGHPGKICSVVLRKTPSDVRS